MILKSQMTETETAHASAIFASHGEIFEQFLQNFIPLLSIFLAIGHALLAHPVAADNNLTAVKLLITLSPRIFLGTI